MFCDRMDVGKSQRVPPFSFFRHCETLARQGLAVASPGASLGPFFNVIFSKKNSKIFRFSTTVNEYLTLGSLFAIFEPWIWRRLGPVPACFFLVGFFQRKMCLTVASFQLALFTKGTLPTLTVDSFFPLNGPLLYNPHQIRCRVE